MAYTLPVVFARVQVSWLALALMSGAGCGCESDLERLAARCESGDGPTCHRLAMLYYRGYDDEGELEVEVEPDEARAFELSRRACELEQWDSCYGVGHAYEYGGPVARDVEAAAGYYRRACDADHGDSCSKLAQLEQLDSGWGERVAELAERGCDLEDGFGCYFLAEMLRQGQGVAMDLPRALALYERACELDPGDGSGCWRAGQLLLGRGGIERDEAAALAHLSEACRRGGPGAAACMEARHLRGQGSR